MEDGMSNSHKQLQLEILEAYTFLRENNNTVPIDTLQFMLDASFGKIKAMHDHSDNSFSKCVIELY